MTRSFNSSKDDHPKYTTILDNFQLRKISEAAKEQDVCLVFINSDSGEGYVVSDGVAGDRNDLYAQKNGDNLVKTVAGVCSKVVVVVHAVGPVLVNKWIDLPSIKAVLFAHLPGQESGNSLVDILFGDINPSGKLPYTVAKKESDYGEKSKILKRPNSLPPQQNFTEGLFIDYRHFDKHGITPQYPFGFGLSYTSFKLSKAGITYKRELTPLPAPRRKTPTVEPPSYPTNIPSAKEALYPKGFKKLNKYIYPYISSTPTASGPHPSSTISSELSPAGGGEGGNPELWEDIVEVNIKVANTGKYDGQEVVQLYVSFPDGVKDEGDDIGFPVKVLRAFEKVDVKSGDEEVVKLTLKRRDLSFWSVRKQNWVIPRGWVSRWSS